jgi:hypothetical protein
MEIAGVDILWVGNYGWGKLYRKPPATSFKKYRSGFVGR